MMEMTIVELRQLRCFVACCDHGTFTAAAASLHLVQSAVSSSVAKLERELGHRLFDRTPTGLRLTPAGAAAEGPARRTLREAAAVASTTAGAEGPAVGTVRLATPVNVRTGGLADALVELRDRHPGVTVAMRPSDRGSSGATRDLITGAVDLALGHFEPTPGVTVLPIAAEPVVLATARDHRLAATGGFTADDLAGERFIDLPRGWGPRIIADSAAPARRAVLEAADPRLALDLAARGYGVTLLSRSLVDDAPDVAAVQHRGAPLTWRLGLAHATDHTPDPATRAVITALRRNLAGA